MHPLLDLQTQQYDCCFSPCPPRKQLYHRYQPQCAGLSVAFHLPGGLFLPLGCFVCLVFVFTLNCRWPLTALLQRLDAAFCLVGFLPRFVVERCWNALAVHRKCGDGATPPSQLHTNGVKKAGPCACQHPGGGADWPAAFKAPCSVCSSELDEVQHPPCSAQTLCSGADWNCLCEHAAINRRCLPSCHPGQRLLHRDLHLRGFRALQTLKHCSQCLLK